MYFPIGWPKYYSSKDVHCGELTALRYNRDRSLLAVISTHSVCIWNNRPRVLVVAYRRSYESMREVGSNTGVVWRPDSSTLAVSTTEGKLVFLEVQKNNGTKLYTPCFASSASIQGNNSSGQNGVTAIKLVEIAVVPITGGITSVAPRKDELFVSTGSGLLQRILWDGNLEGRTTLSIHSLPFTNDLENARALPLEHEGVSFRAMEYSPLLGGFAVVLADGRGGFLSASTARFEIQEILGLWAKDLTSATCVAINHRYRLMAFGCLNGECLVYGFDDLTGALQLSHKLILSSKDYPDTIQSTGSVQCLSWTPDGCAIAVAWSWASHGGLAVWSVFGSLLMCTLGGDYGTSQEAFLHNPLHVKSMGWGPEGYNLAIISAEEDNGTAGEIMQLQFVKSSLAVNPCMSNHEHLFLQSEECLYLNTGDMVSETTEVFSTASGNPNLTGETWPRTGADRSMGHSTLVSNKQWVVIQISHTYLESNWPVRYSAVDKSGHHVAIAGRMGVAHYSLSSRKWKLFGNISQEQSISCRGGLAWWKNFLIVPCYNFQSSTDEIRFYPRTCNLDNAFAQHVKLPAPSFLVNVFRNLLLAYCSDCRVVFFSLEIPPGNPDSTIKVSKLREVSLVEHVPHPLAVIHVTLTSRYMESGDLEGLDGVEALITNVGGWLLMLQKEKAPHGRSKKSSFSSPVVLASCVENVWTSSTSDLRKRHLTEALWLGCGAHGMKVWLPLFPGNDQKPPNFLSKRIMLPFQLNIYPLAVLFQDAVVLGAENEPLPLECTSPGPASMSPQPFPFCTLERTTQVYLHHVLRQLLRRNLGQQALKIANTCVDLPYFPHVLELMLHEVLEEEATASEPIPDALLPRVVAFIQEFPQYLETVVHCARKTEVALWGYLFAAVGNPRELFKESLNLGRLETAASYLIILQNLEQPSVSKQLATILLDRAMDSCKWEIAKDLVRFLRCIGAGELDSPPRSPIYKPMHSPPHSPVASVDEGDISSSMPYGLTTHGRTTSVTKPGSRATLTRTDKAHLSRTPSVEKKSGSLEKARKTFAASSSTSSVEIRRPSDLETPDSFFIDTILNRHARLLLSACRLRDLGRFAAHLEFALVPWLHKERNRAARIDDYVQSVVSVHKQFDLPYPTVSTPAGSAHLPLSPKPWAMGRFGRLGSSSSTGSPSTSRQSLNELDAADVTEEDAQLSPTRGDDVSQVSGDPSETSSVTYSVDGDDAFWGGEGGEGLALVDVDKIRAQIAVSGSKQACKEIRFLLQNVMAAGCYEWWLVLSLVLRDNDSIRDCIDKTQSLRDVSTETVSRMKQGLAELETWAEENCRGYSIFFSLHKPDWPVPSTPSAARKNAPAERRDSGQTQESSRGSRHASTSSDVTGPEEEQGGGDKEPEGEEVKSDYDCVVM